MLLQHRCSFFFVFFNGATQRSESDAAGAAVFTYTSISQQHVFHLHLPLLPDVQHFSQTKPQSLSPVCAILNPNLITWWFFSSRLWKWKLRPQSLSFDLETFSHRQKVCDDPVALVWNWFLLFYFHFTFVAFKLFYSKHIVNIISEQLTLTVLY